LQKRKLPLIGSITIANHILINLIEKQIYKMIFIYQTTIVIKKYINVFENLNKTILFKNIYILDHH